VSDPLIDKLVEMRKHRMRSFSYEDWHQVAVDASLLQSALEDVLGIPGVRAAVERFLLEGE
jgi:hypothetical protein